MAQDLLKAIVEVEKAITRLETSLDKKLSSSTSTREDWQQKMDKLANENQELKSSQTAVAERLDDTILRLQTLVGAE